MRETEDRSGQCSEPGCVAFRFDQAAALGEGWDMVEGALFCPDHKGFAARQALAVAEMTRQRARIDELRAKRNAEKAKRWLKPSDYRAWDEFQSDLANFHKKTGKLAPAALRTLDPVKFTEQYRKTGRIDIELVADSLFEAENRAAETRKWLLGRVE